MKAQAVNEQIAAREVRVISEDGERLGIHTKNEALTMAKERGFDLVLVSGNDVPPVCKLMDFGRHRYEQEKRQRDAKRKQQSSNLKEITLSYKIGEHDYQVRMKRMVRFLDQGHKVKMTVRLRGRERQHSDMAVELLNRFARDAEEVSAVEKLPQQEGYRIIMILNPKKEKKK